MSCSWWRIPVHSGPLPGNNCPHPHPPPWPSTILQRCQKFWSSWSGTITKAIFKCTTLLDKFNLYIYGIYLYISIYLSIYIYTYIYIHMVVVHTYIWILGISGFFLLDISDNLENVGKKEKLTCSKKTVPDTASPWSTQTAFILRLQQVMLNNQHHLVWQKNNMESKNNFNATSYKLLCWRTARYHKIKPDTQYKNFLASSWLIKQASTHRREELRYNDI
jgi:hypothetical protein